MMNFANPSAFFLFILLGFLIWLRERKAPAYRARLPFPSLSLAASVPGTWRTRLRDLPAYLLYAGLALSIVALARPRTLLRGEETHARGIDIMIALDTSGSMRALDFNPKDRMTVAKESTKTFISHRQFDRIGLVVFAGVTLLQCPLTLDYGALLEFLDQVEVGVTTTENTAIGTAIATAANHLKRSTAKSKVIILVTDGRNNSGEIDPLTAAQAAAGLGIKIYAIGVGVHGQSVIPVDTAWGRQLVPIQEDIDEPALEDIARATGGRYYRAASTKEFDQIYGEIDKLEKTDVKGPSTHEYKDQYLGWLILAMTLLSAGYGLQMTLWSSLP
jgi:Ca-activated chloride channel family protein